MRVLLLYALFLCIQNVAGQGCPRECSCKRSSSQRDGGTWLKLRCGDTEKMTAFDDNLFLNISSDIVYMNLSNNLLTAFAPKIQLTSLQKLDLSKNQIVQLIPNQFVELPTLRRLDLSGNNIKIIDPQAFNGLTILDSLKISQNQITTIEKGTFGSFHRLNDLDISSNPLRCDCALLWLLDWSKKPVKLKSNPKCESPPAYLGRPLKKIRMGEEIHCKSPAKHRDIPIVELIPDRSQLVFEGDSLKLQCRAPSHNDFDSIDESEELRDRVEWLWIDTNPIHRFHDVTIDNRFLTDDGLIDSSLIIRRLSPEHTGEWRCQLVTHQGNYTKGITVEVISSTTNYCHASTTVNNKGTYAWPRTIVNHTISLNCQGLTGTDKMIASSEKAHYYCTWKGEWRSLNTSACPYVSETTQILEQFAKVNLSLAKNSVLESAQHLRNTSDVKLLRDVVDFIFATRTVCNYLEYLQLDPLLGDLLLDIINGFMELNTEYIREADREDNSCWKLVRALEIIMNYTSFKQLQKSHIILEQVELRTETFIGITCTWYLKSTSNDNERSFHCASANVSNTENGEIEASVEVPWNLLYQLQERNILAESHNLLVAMFDEAKFFPLQHSEKMCSLVVGVKLANLLVTNLSHPVYVMLKPFESYSSFKFPYDLMPPTPVWWDPTLNYGRGGWTPEGCQLLRQEIEGNVVFSCNQLGYYALLQDASKLNNIQLSPTFRLSHPAVYVGSLILFVCLLLCVLSYFLSYSAIQMPKKAKHAVINMWLAIILLCFVYVFGIYQTEDVQLCQIIGLSLHYLTLSSLLWMCVGVNNMYKRLRKHADANDVIELQDDELPNEQPIQKPILGLYLVGWGIALIVCGISGAVNLKEYATHTHCFLSCGPALSALYVPFGMLLFILLVLFMLIRCAIYSTDANGHLSEGTQATENVDLDLLEPNFPECGRSLRSVSTKTASSEIEDAEHAPMAQLKAYIIFLVLYVFAWVSCALATINNFKVIPYEEDVFSIIYAILASLLGLFALFFYCVARNDIRTEWVLTGRWMRGRGKCFRSRNVSDLPQIQIQPLPPIPDSQQAQSRSSSRSSQSKSAQSNALKAAAADLNASVMTDHSSTKINNVNLVVLHRQQYRPNGVLPNLIENPTHTAEMFYNPHQSTVARKFFKKQKRHMMKRNNLTARRPPESIRSDDLMTPPAFQRDKENASVDTSMFANNSKVNNTNIHVEHVPKRHRNLNILSDSCDDLNSMQIATKLLERKSKGHKRAKKHNNCAAIDNNVNMRSVSQQCTLEYSSEAISDSILDQKSPEGPSFTTGTSTSDMLAASVRRENSPIMSTLTEEAQFYSMPNSAANARIYVNPAHDTHSRASSTEIEELYQQIKRGPASRQRRSEGGKSYRQTRLATLSQEFPFFSDSEVRSYACSDHKCEKDETTV